MRKKKKKGGDLLKADDLQPLEPTMEETAEEKRAREAKLAARRAASNGGNETKFKETLKEAKTTKMATEEIEEGELADEFAGKGGKVKEEVYFTWMKKF